MPDLGDDALVLLKEMVRGVGEAAYADGKKQLIKLWKRNVGKKEFGVTIEPSVADAIKKIGKRIRFEALKNCLGVDFWALNFIRLGMHISEISDDGERAEVDELREEIRKLKGYRASTVVKMGSTGAIAGVINHIESLMLQGYSRESIIEEFEKFVDEWEDITIFVRKGNNNSQIRIKILEKIDRRKRAFFVFSYGIQASKVAMYSIAELRNADQIEPRNYLMFSYLTYDGVGVKVFMWSFRYIQPPITEIH